MLSLTDAAQRLGLGVAQVKQLVKDHKLISLRMRYTSPTNGKVHVTLNAIAVRTCTMTARIRVCGFARSISSRQTTHPSSAHGTTKVVAAAAASSHESSCRR